MIYIYISSYNANNDKDLNNNNDNRNPFPLTSQMIQDENSEAGTRQANPWRAVVLAWVLLACPSMGLATSMQIRTNRTETCVIV
jgi:hypothetical protein